MEFCRNWNQPGSTCECSTCLGPWIETIMGYWRHAFDKLLFTYIKPTRNVIPLDDSDVEMETRRGSESPVSSISDQYSTDESYKPGSTESDLTISSESASSDGILAENDEVFEPSDSDTIIESTDDETADPVKSRDEKNPPEENPPEENPPEENPFEKISDANNLIFDFAADEQTKLDNIFDSVFYPTRPNTPLFETMNDNAISAPPNFFQFPDVQFPDVQFPELFQQFPEAQFSEKEPVPHKLQKLSQQNEKLF